MRREERKALYTETFQLFEGAMREILSGDEFTLAEAFSKNNAKFIYWHLKIFQINIQRSLAFLSRGQDYMRKPAREE